MKDRGGGLTGTLLARGRHWRRERPQMPPQPYAAPDGSQEEPQIRSLARACAGGSSKCSGESTRALKMARSVTSADGGSLSGSCSGPASDAFGMSARRLASESHQRKGCIDARLYLQPTLPRSRRPATPKAPDSKQAGMCTRRQH